MIRIEVTTGNDYHCGCCRRTSSHTEDFTSMKDAIKFYTETTFREEILKEDIYVSGVSIVRDINMKVDPELFEQLKQDKIKTDEAERKKEEEARMKFKKQQLEQLKKELGET